jgi:general secretion pathway protein D
VVDDGQIIVLGGLIEDNYNIQRDKVPLLGDLPFIGGLFRNETRTRKRSNLMVFLRPVVMRDQAASNKVSLDRYDYIRSQQVNEQPPQSTIMDINQSPILPQIRPDMTGPNGVPPPLSDTMQRPVVPSIPASAPETPASAPSASASAPK